MQTQSPRKLARAARAAAFLTEPLEGRTLMSAVLSADLGRFNNGPSSSGPVVTTTSSSGGASASSADKDDRITGASSRSLDFTTSGDISYGFDVDFYKFTAKKGQRVTFDIDLPAGSPLDSYLRLFNAAGQQLDFSDDDTGPNEPATFESFIDYTFNGNNSYYIAVSGASNDSYNAVTGQGDVVGSTGKYTLVVKKYVNPDNDDTMATAKSIGKTDSKSGYISNNLDVDLYKFSVKAGQSMYFNIDTDIANFPLDPLDSYLRLFNANGVEIANNEDGSSPFEVVEVDGQSFLQYDFTLSGTYYIGVSGSGNDAYNIFTGGGDKPGAIGHYTLNTLLLP